MESVEWPDPEQTPEEIKQENERQERELERTRDEERYEDYLKEQERRAASEADSKIEHRRSALLRMGISGCTPFIKEGHEYKQFSPIFARDILYDSKKIKFSEDTHQLDALKDYLENTLLTYMKKDLNDINSTGLERGRLSKPLNDDLVERVSKMFLNSYGIKNEEFTAICYSLCEEEIKIISAIAEKGRREENRKEAKNLLRLAYRHENEFSLDALLSLPRRINVLLEIGKGAGYSKRKILFDSVPQIAAAATCVAVLGAAVAYAVCK